MVFYIHTHSGVTNHGLWSSVAHLSCLLSKKRSKSCTQHWSMNEVKAVSPSHNFLPYVRSYVYHVVDYTTSCAIFRLANAATNFKTVKKLLLEALACQKN